MEVNRINEATQLQKIQKEIDKLKNEFDDLRYNHVSTSDYRYKGLLKKEKELLKLRDEARAEEMGAELYNKAKLSKAITKLTGLKPYEYMPSSVRGYRPIASGSFSVEKETNDTLRVIARTKYDVIAQALEEAGFDIKRVGNDIIVSVFKK